MDGVLADHMLSDGCGGVHGDGILAQSMLADDTLADYSLADNNPSDAPRKSCLEKG